MNEVEQEKRVKQKNVMVSEFRASDKSGTHPIEVQHLNDQIQEFGEENYSINPQRVQGPLTGNRTPSRRDVMVPELNFKGSS